MGSGGGCLGDECGSSDEGRRGAGGRGGGGQTGGSGASARRHRRMNVDMKGVCEMKTHVIGAVLALTLSGAPAAAQTAADTRAHAVPPVTDADDGAYRLSAGDAIEIKFLENPELNEAVHIR